MDKGIVLERARQINDGLELGQRFTWQFRQKKLAERIVREGGDLSGMLYWPTFREALYAGFTHISSTEWQLLSHATSVLVRDPDFIDVPELGPDGASGTYIKQGLVCQTITELSPLHKAKSVVEVGGGYGALAVVMDRFGFRGDHHVLDFEILHLIREWYLSNVGVRTISHTGIDTLPEKCDVLVGVHSLCEMPVELRKEILSKVVADFYVFMVTKRYDGVDNVSWFSDWLYDNVVEWTTVEGTSKNQTLFAGRRK